MWASLAQACSIPNVQVSPQPLTCVTEFPRASLGSPVSFTITLNMSLYLGAVPLTIPTTLPCTVVIRHTSNVDICGCWAWAGEHIPSQKFECDGSDGSYSHQTFMLLAILLRLDPARRLRSSAGRDQPSPGRLELSRPTDVRTVRRFSETTANLKCVCTRSVQSASPKNGPR